MTRLALCLLLLANGAIAQENIIDVEHDSQRGVTCYILNHVGISCVPDSQLQPGGLRQNLQHRDDDGPTPTQAPARWNEERYSL